MFQQEITEENPEIGSMHITQETDISDAPETNTDSSRQRTESTTSVSSESWQNNVSFRQKMKINSQGD